MMNEALLAEKAKLKDPDYGTRKLAHYNVWLLDPNRKPYPEDRYPGFPEDVEREQAVAAYKEEFVQRQAKPKAEKAPKAPRAKRAKRMEGPTKQERAVELYKANMKLSKDNMIALLREKLDMSLAGATTYFYNAKKLA
jgi:hypothetical protein